MSIKEYFSSIFTGLHSLIKGMEVTGKELVTPKVTEQYPENRHTKEWPERFRGTLEFIYDDEGYHKCTACRTCERNCPNQTIQVITKPVDLPNGKKKMVLDRYMYDLGSCTFCNLCVISCPFGAIRFSNDFEQSVLNRDVLVKQLNYKVPEKGNRPKPVVAKPAAPAAAKPAAAAPAAKPATQKPVVPAAKPAAPAAPKAEASAKPNQENKENK